MPCPFCGSKATLERAEPVVWVECNSCGARGAREVAPDEDLTEEVADFEATLIENWNYVSRCAQRGHRK